MSWQTTLSKFVFPLLCLILLLAVYGLYSGTTSEKNTHAQIQASMSAQGTTAQAIPKTIQQESDKPEVISTQGADVGNVIESEEQSAEVVQPESIQEIPGEEIHYDLEVDKSTHYFIQGSASSDIGKINFQSKLLPSNEVELEIDLKQSNKADVKLTAYFDLANFVMELDGKNSVLNKDQKKLMDISSSQIRTTIENQYQGYEYPDHALMLTQMLAYWSVSPEGYVQKKRTIVSR